ncbi:MAG: ATP-dependent Clp protease, ATP-binding subunit ClpC / Negative regulator of genetic competence clcC/mecB, partial [uncultured Rubrobacteraceae bacterium]
VRSFHRQVPRERGGCLRGGEVARARRSGRRGFAARDPARRRRDSRRSTLFFGRNTRSCARGVRSDALRRPLLDRHLPRRGVSGGGRRFRHEYPGRSQDSLLSPGQGRAGGGAQGDADVGRQPSWYRARPAGDTAQRRRDGRSNVGPHGRLSRGGGGPAVRVARVCGRISGHAV